LTRSTKNPYHVFNAVANGLRESKASAKYRTPRKEGTLTWKRSSP